MYNLNIASTYAVDGGESRLIHLSVAGRSSDILLWDLAITLAIKRTIDPSLRGSMSFCVSLWRINY